MKHFDLVIIGAGMVGLALAAQLKNSSLNIALIEQAEPHIPPEQISYRVSALNLASEKLLRDVGAWQHINRATPYQTMKVWEQDSFAKIDFDGQSLGRDHLGHIVENHLIQRALWQQVEQQNNAQIYFGVPQQVAVNENHAMLILQNGTMLTSKLIVGADGAHSWLRKQADIPLTFRDYGHYALVCNVQTDEPHQHCSRQIFSPDSVLAFLPLHQANLCSIVWSLPPEQAQALKVMDDNEFNKMLSVAFDQQLGRCQVQTERQIYPLTARYARNFAQPRIALIGDAAHTIHPLAGLGVNLGFQDAILLAEQLEQYHQQALDIGLYRHLRYFERQRKTEAVKYLLAMQGLKDLFSGDNPVKKLIRGIGLTATNQLEIVKDQFIKQALGL